MKYVRITAKEYNSIYPEKMVDTAIFAVDETKTNPNELVPLLQKLIKKQYFIKNFGEEYGTEPIWFGRELTTIEPAILKKYGVELVNVIDFTCDWDNGELR